jgi:AraC-like DNA-binding protein
VSSFRRAWISGLYQSPFSIESPDPPLLIGARLRPAFQSQLLGHAGSALSGRVLELEEFGVPDVEECRQRMSRMANWGLRFVALEHWLAARLSAGSAPDAGLVWASSQLASGTRAIAELRRELGWSHRLFIARFRETIGLAPKQFGRLARFARLLDSAEAAPHQNWADLSASAGFFDQAHCIREFHSFAGVTPAEYIRLRDASNQSISLQTVE